MKTTLTSEAGYSYIYPVLDWGGDPSGAVITLIIGIVALPLIFAFFWLLTLLRDRVQRKLAQSVLSSQAQHNLAFSVSA